jgi:hypothetical protein
MRTSGMCIGRKGATRRPSRTTRWTCDCKGGGRPGVGGPGVREPRQHVSVAGGLCEGHRVPHAGPGDCKGGGRPGGGGSCVREPRQRVPVDGGLCKGHQYYTQDLAIAKEVGDRTGEGRAYGNLGCAYGSQRDYAKAIEHHWQHLAFAKRLATRFSTLRRSREFW